MATAMSPLAVVTTTDAPPSQRWKLTEEKLATNEPWRVVRIVRVRVAEGA